MATAGNSEASSGEYSCLREELYEAAIFVVESIRRIHAGEKTRVEIGRGDSADHDNLLDLKSDMLQLSEKIARLADSETQKMEGSETKGIIRPVRIGGEGRLVLMQSNFSGGGKSISKQFKELQLLIKEQFKELPDTISMSITKSVGKMIDDIVEEAEKRVMMVDVAVGFKYGLLSGQFDDLWDEIRQLASTESKFLAICMFSESFVRCCSTLKFISTVINKLGNWVPELSVAMKSIKEDVPKVDGDGDGDGDVDVDGDVDEYEEEKKAEEYCFAAHRRCWESIYSNGRSFEDPTLFSSMHFTHYMPGHSGQTPMGAKFLRTMQIYSIKVTETEGIALEWPLEVYGVVAARDMVDYCRNLLFHRTRDDCQILTKENPFLHLTGPSRAIMSGDTVTIEAELKLKGTVRSKDRLFKAFRCDDDNYGDGHARLLLQGLCTMELQCEHIEQSVQATILSVCVVHGSLPCENGIVCYAVLEDKTEGIVNCSCSNVSLLDSQAGKMPVDEEGNLELSRQVVSVKSKGRLNIFIKALSACGEISGSVAFIPKSSNVSQESCSLGGCEVEITVAWSLLVESQHVIELKGSAEPYEHELNPRTPLMKLEEDAC